MTKLNVRALGIVPRYVLQLSFAGVVPACASNTGADVADTVSDPSSTVSQTSASVPRPQQSYTIVVLATVGFSNPVPPKPVPSNSVTTPSIPPLIVLAICGFCNSSNPPQPGVPTSATSAPFPDGGVDVPGVSLDGGYFGDAGEVVDGSASSDAGLPDAATFEAGPLPTDPGLIVLAIQGFANTGTNAG